MPIEHSQTPWGNYLRSVHASRGLNLKVVGQSMEDLLRGNVLVGDLSHLASPLRWTQSGWRAQVTAVAAQFSRMEIRAVRPFWLTFLRADSECHLEVLDVHVLATADVVPPTVFGEPPTVVFREGATVTAADANSFLYTQVTSNRTPIALPGNGLFVPEGKILACVHDLANLALDISPIVVEVPDPSTPP